MIISTVLSEKPLIEGNSVTLPIVKSGTKAYDNKGKEYILTKEALESSAESWTGGIVTINHMVKEEGTITKSWFEDPYVYATFEGLSPETVDAINSKAYRGVSQESEPIEVKGSDVLKLKGTGSTFVFYPFKPACPMKEGCGLPIASCDPDFNFPLNTPNQKLQSNEPGGVNIADDNVTKLESTISEQKTEIESLKSTVDELRQEIKHKDETIKSTAKEAAYLAVETYIKSTAEKTERETILNELKSTVSAEKMETLAEKDIDTLRILASTIKDAAGKRIGASGGNGGGDNKIMSTYKAGNDIYSKLGVEADDLEKYGGVTE
jgi:uncharacterized coiled-coil protein SlyX